MEVMDRWVTYLGHRLLSGKAGIGFHVCLGHISPTNARGIPPAHCPLPAASMGHLLGPCILFHIEEVTGTSQPVTPLGWALQKSTEVPPPCQAPTWLRNEVGGGWVTDRRPSSWDVFPAWGGGLCAVLTVCKPNQVRAPTRLGLWSVGAGQKAETELSQTFWKKPFLGAIWRKKTPFRLFSTVKKS